MPRLCRAGVGVGLAPVLGLPVYPTGSSSVISHVLVPTDGDPCAHSGTGALLVPQVPADLGTTIKGHKTIRECSKEAAKGLEERSHKKLLKSLSLFSLEERKLRRDLIIGCSFPRRGSRGQLQSLLSGSNGTRGKAEAVSGEV